MDKKYFQKLFSDQRTQKYFDTHPDDTQKAIEHYFLNIKLSETFYPLLTIFEVSLRNSINRELIKFFKSTDWYVNIKEITELKELSLEIEKSETLILNRKEQINPDKIIAELTLGFWTRLFNSEYENILWKDLRRAFPFCPKNKKQRKNISAPLNKIRIFRNRVYHYEPIAWNLDALEVYYNEIFKVLEWINFELPGNIAGLDRFRLVLSDARIKLNLSQFLI